MMLCVHILMICVYNIMDGSVCIAKLSVACHLLYLVIKNAQEIISGLNASVVPVTLGSPSVFDIVVDTGTGMQVTLDTGDLGGANTVIDETLETKADLAASTMFQFTYQQVGTYTVIITVTNSRGQENITVYADVDIPIAGAEASTKGATPGNEALVLVSATAGSRITVFNRYSDGTCIETLYDSFADLPTAPAGIGYDFNGVLGNYPVETTISNSLGYFTFNLETGINTEIQGFAFPDQEAAEPNITKFFKRIITQGDFMTCAYFFGDDYILVQQDDSPALEEIVNHTYTEMGDREVVVNCYNHYSCHEITYTQQVMFGPSEIKLSDEVLPLLRADSGTITFNISQGSNLVFSVAFIDKDGVDHGDLSTASSYTGVTEGYSEGSISFDFSSSSVPLGSILVVFTLTNAVRSVNATAQVISEHPIQNFDATSSPGYDNPDTVVSLTASLDSGTNVLFVFHDYTLDITHLYITEADQSPPQVHTDQKSEVGYYKFEVSALNNVTCASKEILYGLENDVLDGITVTASNVDYQSDAVGFTLTHPSSPNPPYGVWTMWNFGDEIIELISSQSLYTNNVFNHSYTYEQYGIYQVEICVYNNISSKTVATSVTVGVPVQGLDITIPTDPVARDTTQSFTVESTEGSNIQYIVEWGDTTSSLINRSSTVWRDPNSETLEHSFPKGSEIVSIALKATNYLGEFLGPTKTLTIYEPVAGLSCKVDNKVNVAVQILHSFTYTCTVTAGTYVKIKVDYDDALSETKEFDTNTLDSSTAAAVTFTKSYITAKTFKPIFTASNAVAGTSVDSLVSVTVQHPFTAGMLLFAQDSDTYFDKTGPAEFELCLNPGTASPPSVPIICTWTFGDGSSIDVLSDELLSACMKRSKTFTPLHEGPTTTQVLCANNVTSDSTQLEVYMVQSLNPDLVQFNGDEQYSKYKNPIQFTLSCEEGTLLDITFRAEDGSADTTFHIPSCPDTLQFSHTFLLVGIFTVYVDIVDGLGSAVTKQAQVIVQREMVDGFKLVNSGPVPLVRGQTAQCTFELQPPPLQPDEVPTDVSFKFDYIWQSTWVSVGETMAELKETVPFYHDYASVGSYVAKIEVFNDVSTRLLETQVTVIEVVSGVAFNTIPVSAATGQQIEISFSAQTGSSVNFTAAFGDGQSDTTISDDGGTAIFKHTYQMPGTYTVQIIASNPVSAPLSMTQDILIQNPIVEEDFKYDIHDAKIGSDVKILTISLVAGAKIPSQVLLSDSDGKTPVVFPVDISKAIPASASGTFTYELTLENDVSSPMEKSLDIPIVKEIVNARFDTADAVVLVEVGLLYTPSILFDAGTDVEVIANWGSQKEDKSVHEGDLKQVNLEHTFSSPGLYTLNVICKNIWGEVSLSIDIKAMVPIKSPLVEAESYVETNKDFILRIKSSGDIKPTEAKALIIWEEGSEAMQYDKPFTDPIVHIFHSARLATVGITLQNDLGTKIMDDITVNVQDPVTDLDIVVKGVLGMEDGIPVVPFGKPVELEATFHGTAVQVKWELPNDEQVGINAAYTPTNAGLNDIILKGQNEVSQNSIIKSIMVKDSVNIKVYALNKNKIQMNEDIILTFGTEEYPLQVCFEIILECESNCIDPLRNWIASDASLCSKSATYPPSSDKIKALDKTPALSWTVKWTLSTAGMYQVKMLTYTHSIKSLDEVQAMTEGFEVEDYPCKTPTVSSVYSRSNPKSHKKSDEIYVTIDALSNIVTNCSIPQSKVFYNYTLYHSFDLDGEMVEVKQLNAKPATGGYKFASHDMDYGLWKVVVTVTVIKPRNGSTVTDGIVTFPNYMYMRNKKADGVSFIHVKQSPLEAKITGGSLVTWSWGEKTTLNGLESFDPDAPVTADGKHKDFKWIWKCRRENEEDDPNNAVKVPLDDPKEMPKCVKVGGCFCTGPGTLDMHTATVTFNTGHMFAPQKYIVTLEVMKDGRTASTQQTIQVQLGKAPQIDLRCLSINCKLNKINPQLEIQFEVEFPNLATDVQPAIEWKLLIGEEAVAIEDITEITTGGNKGYFTIKPNSIKYNTSYSIQVVGSIPGFAPGLSRIDFETSCKCQGSNADRASTNETVPLKAISIKAIGWTCSCAGNELPKFYSFGYLEEAVQPNGEIKRTERFPYPDFDVSTIESYSPPPGFINNMLTVLIKVCDEVKTCVVSDSIQIKSALPPPPEGKSQGSVALELAMSSIETTNIEVDPMKTMATLTSSVMLVANVGGSTSGDGTSNSNSDSSGASGHQGSGTSGNQGSGSSNNQGSGTSGNQGSATSGNQGSGTSGSQGSDTGGNQGSGTGGSSSSGGTGAGNSAAQQPTKEELEAEAEKQQKEAEEAKQKVVLAVTKTISSMVTSGKENPPGVYLMASAMLAQTLEVTGDNPPTQSKKDTFRAMGSVRMEGVADPNVVAEMSNSFTSTMGKAIANETIIEPIKTPEIAQDETPNFEELDDQQGKLDAEQKEKKEFQREAAEQTAKLRTQIQKSMRKKLVPNSKPKVFGDGSFQVRLASNTPDNIGNQKQTAPTSVMELREEQKMLFRYMHTTSDSSAFLVSSGYMTSQLYGFEGCCNLPLNNFVLLDQFGDPIEFEQGPVVAMEDVTGNNYAMDKSNKSMQFDNNTGLVYLSAVVQTSGLFVMELNPSDEEREKGIYFTAYIVLKADMVVQHQPNKTYYDLKVEVSQETKWQIRLNEGSLSVGYNVYIGVETSYKTSNREKRQAIDGVTEAPVAGNATVPDFNVKTVMMNCRAWDEENEKWLTNSCNVSDESTMESVTCNCGKMGKNIKTFSGDFVAPTVNPINFEKIFDNFLENLAAAPTVFSVLLVILFLYIVFGIWARRMDRKDIERWGAYPLLDNERHHTYFYKVSVYTGLRQNAGTRSHVCCILSGERQDTGVRVLDSGRTNHAFTRGSVRNFILSTSGPLGQLTFCRIWHDNAGKSEHASWFLDKIVVEDLQTDSSSYFLCSDWLAVDEGDGTIDKSIPVANMDELTGFRNLFYSKARINLTEDHIWISIFSRPIKSAFTRLQRLTCGVSLLYTTMLANAMFYNFDDGYENDRSLVVGPFIFSAAGVIVSIYATLVVIPVNTIVMTLFRKSKPKEWTSQDDQRRDDQRRKKAWTDENSEPPPKKLRWWKQKYPLPHWCIYISWTLAFLSIAVSATFVTLYSLDWGKEKSEMWLGSLLLSFVESAAFIQPVKVVFMAMVIALLFKTLDDLDDTREAKATATKPKEDEEMDNIIRLTKPPTFIAPKPLSQKKIERARLKREYEKKMWSIIKEVSFYFVFLVLVSFIAWGPQDNRIFKMNEHLKHVLSGPEKPGKWVNHSNLHPLSQVHSGFDFWSYMEHTAIPQLFYAKDYNGKGTTLRERKYLNDMYSYRVGSVRLRQNRISPAKCIIPKAMSRHSIECNMEYNMFEEEDRNFTAGWIEHEGEPYTGSDRFNLSWKYSSMLDLKGLPYWARMSTYSGGGYVADLGISEYHAAKQLTKLKEHSWIDHYTRSVFLELTIYNPNLGLFAYVNFLFEFPSTGGVMPFERVTSFNVYSNLEGIGGAVLGAQIIYIMILIFYIFKEGMKLRRGVSQYFDEPWNYIEIGVIVISAVAIAMYTMREMFGRLVMASLKEDREAYTNYMALATYDETLMYVVGCLVFIANIKFLRLLRFNQHVRDFTETLKHSRKSLSYYFITFTIIINAYSMWGYVIFGKHLYSFHQYYLVIETLVSLLLGKMDDVKSMDEADPHFGKLYFICFVMIVFFVLMNMLISIITTAYREVREQSEMSDQSDLLVMDFIGDQIRAFFGKKKKHKKQAIGADYVDTLDVLDKRLDSIDNIFTEELKQIPIQYKKKFGQKMESVNIEEIYLHPEKQWAKKLKW